MSQASKCRLSVFWVCLKSSVFQHVHIKKPQIWHFYTVRCQNFFWISILQVSVCLLSKWNSWKGIVNFVWGRGGRKKVRETASIDTGKLLFIPKRIVLLFELLFYRKSRVGCLSSPPPMSCCFWGVAFSHVFADCYFFRCCQWKSVMI